MKCQRCKRRNATKIFMVMGTIKSHVCSPCYNVLRGDALHDLRVTEAGLEQSIGPDEWAEEEDEE